LIDLLLHDREHLIRGHAAWALGQIGGKNAMIALEEAEQSETDPIILAEIEAALSNL
jgi:epoxyqueuosine reductase